MTEAMVFVTAGRIVEVHCEGCANPCLHCRTLTAMRDAAVSVNATMHALNASQNASQTVRDPNLTAAAETLLRAIAHEAAVSIQIVREDALEEVLEAQTIPLANEASDRFAHMFPDSIAELNRRLAEHLV